MRSNVGIYFGIKYINIIHSKAKKIINAIQIPHDRFAESDLEDKVPQDVKIVAMIKEELRRQGIEIKDVGLALSGRDLIIRSFELPSLPREELTSAINFEVKKYLPFKIEDLIFDFQLRMQRKEKKILVLFFGIKKEAMDSYLSIMKNLGLKVEVLEYSAFSILRLAKIINLNMKGLFALIDIDLEDETNFMVLENGFPLFSRDIDLSSIIDTGIESLSQKLKSEIQLSLDYYYHRKFPSKSINKIIFLGPGDFKSTAKKFSQDLELQTEFIDISEQINKGQKINLSTLKAYGASLAGSTDLPLKFNLISNWEKRRVVGGALEGLGKVSIKELLLDRRAINISIFIFIFTFILGLYPRLSLQRQLKTVLNTRPKLLTVLEGKSYEELKAIDLDYNIKIDTVNKLLNRYPYLTLELNVLPRLAPEGIWLTEFNFLQDDKGRELLLKGVAYLGDYTKELEAINEFFLNIKNNPDFLKTFKTIGIVSIERAKMIKKEVANFAISCKY